MLKGIFIFVDQVIEWEILDALRANLTVTDLPTGSCKQVQLSNFELAAALALAIAGDEIPGSETLYKLAEPVMERLEDKLRIIP